MISLKFTREFRDGITGDFMVSVWMELAVNERQLLGSMELNEPLLYDALGGLFGRYIIYLYYYI
jgi:hypothetical protein